MAKVCELLGCFGWNYSRITLVKEWPSITTLSHMWSMVEIVSWFGPGVLHLGPDDTSEFWGTCQDICVFQETTSHGVRHRPQWTQVTTRQDKCTNLYTSISLSPRKIKLSPTRNYSVSNKWGSFLKYQAFSSPTMPITPLTNALFSISIYSFEITRPHPAQIEVIRSKTVSSSTSCSQFVQIL